VGAKMRACVKVYLSTPVTTRPPVRVAIAVEASSRARPGEFPWCGKCPGKAREMACCAGPGPFWAKDPHRQQLIMPGRDGAGEAAYRGLPLRRCCPAMLSNGKKEGRKQPYHFRLSDGPFAFAPWKLDGQDPEHPGIDSCSCDTEPTSGSPRA